MVRASLALPLLLFFPICHLIPSSAFISTRRVSIAPTSIRRLQRTRYLSHHNLALSPTSSSISHAVSSTFAKIVQHVTSFNLSPSTFFPYLPLVLPLLLLRPVGLSRPLFVASLRTLLQLSVLGGLVLSYLFQQSNPAVVLPYLSALAVIASGEACKRSKYTYPRLRLHALGSLLFGCGSALFFANPSQLAAGGLNAKKIIPLWGLVLGNSVTAVALLASNLVTALTESKSDIDLYLSRGATVREAMLPTIKAGLSAALTPTINSLSVCGLVHIPGVMAGSILAGMDPSTAGQRQAAVMLMLGGASSTSSIVMTLLIMRGAFDWDWQRICNGWEQSVSEASNNDGTRKSRRERQGDAADQATESTTMSTRRHIEATPLNGTITDDSQPVVLEASNVPIPRSNCRVSFQLRKGHRLGITGRSGIGKTTLLRALSLLEGDAKDSKLKLYGKDPAQYGAPRWRRMVSWVSQHRPSLSGSPLQFHREVQSFHSGQNRGKSQVDDPMSIASKWDLDASLLNRSWSLLSGGESARASLASTVALGGDVLLLDEPTVGCDARTESMIENSLKEMGCPLIIVTHSREQLNRFCTHHINLDE